MGGFGTPPHFSNVGRTRRSTNRGLAAQLAAVALHGALDPATLDGKTGRFEIQGFGGGASLQAWVDGQPVFRGRPVPFAGTGLLGHGLKGEMTFTLHA